MKSSCSCAKPGRVQRTLIRSTSWMAPGLLLVLMPKCPLCLAAWLSLVFGIGLTTTAATTLHSFLFFGGSLITLAFFSHHLFRLARLHRPD